MSQFSRRHFQDIDIRELIQHYKQYDCLWDYNSPDYKNQATKYQAWKEIANSFNKDVEEVKRKIKYLRSAYVAERKKVEASKKVSPNSLYKPNLFYYYDLDFLDNIVAWRTFGNDAGSNGTQFANVQVSQDTEEEDEMLSFANRVEEVDFKESDICKSELILEPEPDLSPPSRTPMNSTSLISNSRGAQKRRLSEEDNKPKKSPTVQYSKSKNLYMIFGKTMSLQLQQLPIDVAVLTMSEIHTILTQKTLEHIRSEQIGNESEFEDSFSELIEETTNDEI